ncbi:hypothetical protein OIDMADRAFT_147038 [Oidiodendron maius Zn]|uniref:Uncharacterized protein n=1 Tax=Oidiodendron maius (strain Zn) TaxID=913774 RepID=A0A0C3H7Z3_OIDMZ|nr:hypothetical protein OIDMADRAFT_147038 [Oidiodendron maius Zn]
MALTIQQQESWQLALVSLFILSLSTLLCQALLRAPDQEPGTQPSRDKEFFTALGLFVLLLLWIGAFLGWILCLGAVSGSSRNVALLYGVTAANGGVVYLLTRKQEGSATLQSYISAMFWPMYLGMMLGTIMAVAPEIAISKMWGA